MKAERAFNSPKQEPKIQSLKLKYARGEHIEKGVKRITACIAAPWQFWNYSDKRKEIREINSSETGESIITCVDFYGKPDDLKKRGFKNSGSNSYVISPVDGKDKLTERIVNCTAMVATGQEKETRKNISFMSHQNPDYFLSNEKNKQKFLEDLHQQLEELKARSIEGTIDVAILGGSYFNKVYKGTKEAYVKSIKLLSSEVIKTLGFEPLVITGPQIEAAGNAVYDNENRQLYIDNTDVDMPRFEGRSCASSYYPGELESRMKEWDKEL